jgi:hypothetical protein
VRRGLVTRAALGAGGVELLMPPLG